MAHIARFSIPAIGESSQEARAALTRQTTSQIKGSPEQKAFTEAVAEFKKAGAVEIPCFVDGKSVKSTTTEQVNPADYKHIIANVHQADQGLTKQAIESALKAKMQWENMPWADRAAIFLKAADLVAGKYRAKIGAATMLGQGKNFWQAEIDSAAELVDFLRFSVKYAEDIYSTQPVKNSKGVWNRVEYRPLDGFVLAITPFNFTAIAANLPSIPALLGNVVLWKPSPMAMLSSWTFLEILHEAGLPKNVIQFLPGPPHEICPVAFGHPDFASLHFTGSTSVFKQLWKDIVSNIDTLKSYPRIVGETGGKNFHLLHPTANVDAAVFQSIRAAFEYSGQKCSALSRLYVPESLWPEFKDKIVKEIAKIKVGSPEDATNFMGPVISKTSFDKITSFIEKAKKADGEILAGGDSDMSTGFFVQPTLILTKDPMSVTMVEEIFGPVITAYVYPDNEFKETCALIEKTTPYALTGAIFAEDRQALVDAQNLLRSAAGNFYINDKCTGAVVGQQPFGGSKASGTNDKAGSAQLLYRFLNTRSIKENFVHPTTFLYPSNQE